MAHLTKPQDLSYLGSRVRQFELREAGKDGPRWIYTDHIDAADPRNGGWAAGTCTVRKVRGNGLRGTFRELEPTCEVERDDYAALERAASR